MKDRLLEDAAILVEIVHKAGNRALADFRPGARTAATISYKDGGSPVTSADIAADTMLKTAFAVALPDYGWFSEETADTPDRLGMRNIIIADPIDGTRAFTTGLPQWCVSVALVTDGKPIIGCLYAPALQETYLAVAGQGATLNGQSLVFTSPVTDTPSPVAHGPKPMIEWLNTRHGFSFEVRPKIPSLALRIAMIAAGSGNLGLASPNAHDWDIVAADLILCEAGGRLVDFYGRKPVYNLPDPVHPALLAGSDELVETIIRQVAMA